MDSTDQKILLGIGTVILILIIAFAIYWFTRKNVSVSVVPAFAIVPNGESIQLSAIVTNASNPAVDWSVSDSLLGYIDSTGLFTATGDSGTMLAIATSRENSKVSGTAMITVNPALAIAPIMPPTQPAQPTRPTPPAQPSRPTPSAQLTRPTPPAQPSRPNQPNINPPSRVPNQSGQVKINSPNAIVEAPPPSSFVNTIEGYKNVGRIPSDMIPAAAMCGWYNPITDPADKQQIEGYENVRSWASSRFV